ncbi:D-alanyl-D-alanine carboxypeptidase family protein [Planococcus beigongshangi]|uniref:D-alanyl-D-alanine carboxypeptidase family protein n=1 Tax=Planococcus beigongshangi TaxID=2782536 RepID=UPI00193B16DF|nr:M15 family metallopeptidase [Planococcus beigongshangi]
MVVALQTLIDRSVKNMGTGIHPRVKEYAVELIRRAYKEGIYVQISSGYRSHAEQQRLYNQGRTSPGNIVTNAKPGQSIHNYGLAIDYFLVSDDGNTALWTVNAKWRRVAAIAKSMGFQWGGDWKSFVDYPHLDMQKRLSLAQLAAGKRPTIPPLSSSTDVEQVSKPTTPLPTNVLGTVEVLVDSLNVRNGASFTAKVEDTIKRGETYRAYEIKNGLYNLGGNQWVSAGPAYVRFVRNPAYKDPAAQAKKEAEKLANEKAKQQQQKDEQHIKKAIEKGIVNGERMNEPLTRRQGTLMIMRALDQK